MTLPVVVFALLWLTTLYVVYRVAMEAISVFRRERQKIPISVAPAPQDPNPNSVFVPGKDHMRRIEERANDRAWIEGRNPIQTRTLP